MIGGRGAGKAAKTRGFAGKRRKGDKGRIVLIGPVYPYKGGISHYTGLMCRALSERYEVWMVSYSLQYPRLLYKKEQRDYENDSFKIEGANYWLNTAAPWSWFRCGMKIRSLEPDFVIIQWWHPYFAPCYQALEAMLKGIRILFVCHNVFPHERFPFDRLLTRMTLRKGAGFIVQSSMDAEDLKRVVPGAIYRQTVHPTYQVFKFRNLGREESRRILGIGEREQVLLFFGFVREYKGLKHLIRAMPLIAQPCKMARLLIVGDFGSDKEDYLNLIKECGIEGRVTVYGGYLPDREVEPYFSASDLVVLPYESATQSGIVQIAFGFDKPVVVTRVGGLPDVVEDGKTGYVVDSADHGKLAEAVIRYFKEGKDLEFAENVRREAARFSWNRMVEAIEELDWMTAQVWEGR